MEFYNERKYNKPMQFEYMLMKPEGYVCVQEADKEKGIPAKYEPVYIELGYIDYITDNVDFKLNAYDELKLTIPKYVQDPMNGFQRMLSPAWEMIRDEYVIEISNNISDYKQRFVITNVGSESEATSTKPVEAMSLEYEYHRKQMRNFSSRTIDENYMDIDKPWYLRDILNHINEKYMDNTWSVGYIDSNVAVKMRTFDYSEGSVYGFFSKLQESFCCVFKFDTINRLVNVYDLTIYPVCPKCHKSEYLVFYDNTLECYNPDCYIDVDDTTTGMFDSDGVMSIIDKDGNERTVLAKDGEKANWLTYLYGRDTGLYLHEKNYIAKFNETSDTDEMATRLYVYGKDELGINTATENFSGQPYIEDFSYYRNDKYMTDELLEALDRYDELYNSCKGEWIKLNDEHYNLIRKLSEAKVISSNGKNLLENLQLQINAVKAMTSLQANGYTTETLDELKEKLKEYWDTATVYVDDENTKYLGDLLEKISVKLEGQTKPIVDLANAIKQVVDGVEHEFDIMKQAMEKEGLEEYSLEQLEEALNVYNTRIKVLLDISNNIVSADVNSELTTGNVWDVGDKIYYRLIYEDVNKGTAETEFDNFDSPYVLTEKTNGFFEINLPSAYTAQIRANAAYVLQVWLAKKIGDDKYEDRILQTEDVQYYVLETGNTSGSAYKIRQNSVDLTIIKNSLETAIEEKKKVVAEIEQAQEVNNEAIAALKLKMSKETATYIDENTGEKKLIFPTELILEMNKFIKEQIYTNDTIGVADIIDDTQTDLYKQRVDELYQEGLTVLDTKHTPTVEFTIDIVNFMRDIRYQRDWDKISLGDMIHVGHMDASSDDYIVRIIEWSWSNSDTKLNLTLSNEDRLKSSDALVHQFMKDTIRTNATMSVKKEQWNNAQSNAVDEILNNGWDAAISAVTCGDDVNVTMDNKGLTFVNALNSNKQMRLTDNVLAFSDDNWNTTKTAISNGNVLADNIVGRFLVGKMLQIIATKEDGTTVTFRVNGEGVKLDNGSLIILPMNGNFANSNGITLSPDPHEGFKCTGFDSNSNACFEIKMNAQDGMMMYTLDSNGNPKTYMLKANVNGDLLINGVVYAKDLCLGGINNQSVITYIDAKTGRVTDYNIGDDNKDVLAAIQGQNISCAGLMIKNGNTMFSVNDKAEVTIANGSIKMISGTNELYIDPENFIRWIINGVDKFYYDQQQNALVFGGTIDTLESVKVGETIVVRDSNGDDGLVISAKGGMTNDAITLTANHGRYIDITSNLVRINNNKVLTEADKIDIENDIKSWVRENFAPKGSTNPITPMG